MHQSGVTTAHGGKVRLLLCGLNFSLITAVGNLTNSEVLFAVWSSCSLNRQFLFQSRLFGGVLCSAGMWVWNVLRRAIPGAAEDGGRFRTGPGGGFGPLGTRPGRVCPVRSLGSPSFASCPGGGQFCWSQASPMMPHHRCKRLKPPKQWARVTFPL